MHDRVIRPSVLITVCLSWTLFAAAFLLDLFSHNERGEVVPSFVVDGLVVIAIGSIPIVLVGGGIEAVRLFKEGYRRPAIALCFACTLPLPSYYGGVALAIMLEELRHLS